MEDSSQILELRSLSFSTPTPTCVSKNDSYFWYDSWLHKIYQLLL